MKNSTFKFLATIALSLLIYTLNAQTADQTICGQGAVKNYTVDTTAPDGASPDGTDGSFYTWTVTGAGYAGTLTAGDDPDGPGANDSNQATIDWGATPIGLYTVTVIETNGTCIGEPVEFTVEIVDGPAEPTIDFSTSICFGDDAIFTINGAPGNVFIYTIDGGAPQTATIGADGTFDVIITAPTTDVTIIITSIATDGSADACTSTINVTATIVVTPQPVTSQIIGL